MPAAVTIDSNELRSLVKDAVAEALREQLATMREIIDEEMEDKGLLRAMDEVATSARVSRDEITGILKAKQ